MESSSLNSTSNLSLLYKKLHSVYQDVTYIRKDKKNTFFGYTYASEAAIKDHLHEAFAKHGLIMLPPEMREPPIEESRTNEKGKVEIVTTAKIFFSIADVDTGASVSGSIYGRGIDGQDKGIYKAITGGLKYWLTTLFLIPTGDDPENDAKQEPKQTAPAPKKTAAPAPAKSAPVAPKPAPAKPAGTPVMTQGVLDMINAMNTVPAVTGTLKLMKEDLIQVCGPVPAEGHYKRIMAPFVNNEGGFSGSKSAKLFAAQLWKETREMEANLNAVDRLEITDDDVPPIIGDQDRF